MEEYGNIVPGAKFNEGWFITLRSHGIQENLNMCRLNLLNWQPKFNCFNYELTKIFLDRLLSESISKFNDEERKMCYNIKKP